MNAKQQQFARCANDLKLLAKESNTTADYVRFTVFADCLREAAKGHARYEALRCLNPREYTDMWRRNLAGEGRFDELVDELVKAKNEPN